jgi:3-oxoacyl-[acyl-carrier protein] reductase
MPHCSASKAALLNMTKSMSKAFAAEDILVNSVSPAFILTSMSSEVIKQRAKETGISFEEAEKHLLGELRPHIELKRTGRIEEVGSAVAYLASESASFITGTNLRVDGGLLIATVLKPILAAYCSPRWPSPPIPRTATTSPAPAPLLRSELKV